MMGLFPLLVVPTQASTWYVDSGATGLNNGTSWANAWTSLSLASGSSVAAGDTVYVSGGPSGGSRSYSGNWAPKSGNASANITYQIGQDSSHNGTANFSGASNFPANTPSYCIISGDAGDGLRHFSVAGISQIFAGGDFNNLRISYVNFNTINNPSASNDAMYLGSGTGFRFDHNFLYVSGVNTDGGLHVDQFNGTGYDQNWIDDNIIYTPTTSGSPSIGADGIVMSGNGFTISNNVVISYPTTGSFSGQHSDGWQTSGATYVKVENNLVLGFGDIGLYGGCWGNAVSGGSHYFCNVRYLNNIVDSINDNAAGSIVVEADQGSGSYFTNIWVYNNIARTSPSSPNQPPPFQFHTGDGKGTFANFYVSNNIAICPSSWNGGYLVQSANMQLGDNAQFTDSQAASLFVSFVAASTNNNYRLAATASSLIGKGSNLYSIFTFDKDGNGRPSTSAWDIGPYQSGVAPTNPVIAVTPGSLDFGLVATGTSVTNKFTVQNAGVGTLSGTASVAAPFGIVSGGSYSLGPNSSQTVSVSFGGASAGGFSNTITFTGGGGATAVVTGTARALSGISVSPGNASIFIGTSQQFSALGTYSDGSTQDLTSAVSWSSSASSVATINATGLASAAASGTTTISAASAGMSGNAVLSVQAVPLTIGTSTLPGGTTNVAYAVKLSATGGTSPYSWSITSGSLPPGLALSAGSGTIGGVPTTAGTFNFTVLVTDASSPMQTSGNTFTIVVSTQPQVLSIWPNTATPVVADQGPDSSVELGIKFQSDVDGTLSGIRFYKAVANTGTHIGTLWASDGTELASATFANESASGWQQVNFSTPVSITSNTVYIASYHAPAGHYSEDNGYFASSGYDNPPLHALSNAAGAGNCVYSYGSTTVFPNQTYLAANYWIDVVFQPQAPQRPDPPTGLHVVAGN